MFSGLFDHVMKFFNFDISTKLHSRWCSYIIHRYLGHLLETKISLDELSLDLSNGKIQLNNLVLNAQYINAALSAQNIPIELISGYVGTIVITVPWKSLTATPTECEVTDLQLEFQVKQSVRIDDREFVSSMIGSVVESLVSSAELARSFCEEEKVKNEELEGTDGIHAFTKIIDAIISRFYVKFSNTIVRFEKPPQHPSTHVTAICVDIEQLEFMDEQMKACRQENGACEAITAQPQGVYNVANLNKFVSLKGLSFFTDVLSELRDNSTDMRITSLFIHREKQKQAADSPDDPMPCSTSTISASQYLSCHSTLPSHGSLRPPPNKDHSVDEPLESNPVKFADFGEETTIVIRINNSDLNQRESHEKKVKIEVSCSGLHVFLTPSQVYILQQFFTNLTLAQTATTVPVGGRDMDDRQFDIVMRQQIEENKTAVQCLQTGNWSYQESFQEFSSVRLEESDGNRSDTITTTQSSIRTTNNRNDATKFHARINTIVMVIAHEDPLGVARTEVEGAIQSLNQESHHFFATMRKLKINSQRPLVDIRSKIDEAYPKDHLRFVSAAVVIDYEVSEAESTRLKMTFINTELIESLRPESVPLSSTRVYSPLMVFDKAGTADEHIKVDIAANTRTNKTEIKVFLDQCHTEIDPSLIDRMSNLLCPKPFFVGATVTSQTPQLQQLKLSDWKNFMEEKEVQKPQTNTQISIKEWTIDLRIPIADLNECSKRRPYTERSVHPEMLRVRLEEVVVALPELDSQKSLVEIQASKLHGYFLGESSVLECTEDEMYFLYGAKMFGETTKFVRITLSYDARNKSLQNTNVRASDPDNLMEKSFSAKLLESVPKKDGPFSQVHQSYTSDASTTEEDGEENEQKSKILRAGSREEMLEWAESCSFISDVVLDISIPNLKAHIPNHKFLEVLYNRLANDLALWEPSAPSLRGTQPYDDVGVDKFKQCKNDASCSDDEAYETVSSATTSSIDRSRNHKLSLKLNLDKSHILLGTDVIKDGEKIGSGQILLDVESTCMYVLGGYHGNMLHTFLFFTTNKIKVTHCNRIELERKVNDISFGNVSRCRDGVQLERATDPELVYVNSRDDSLSVALEMKMRDSQADRRDIKDVLLAISVRQLQANLKPFGGPEQLWVTQIASIFTLQDYEVPGYELPIVSTELHLHLEEIVAAYDHCNVKKDSPIRVRFVIGQADLSSVVISTLSMCELLCVFEKARVFLTDKAPSEESSKKVRFGEESHSKTVDKKIFVQMIDIGLFQLEVRFPLAVMEDNTTPLNTPLFEIRCRNDIVKVWACADSLVTVLNMLTEIAESPGFSNDETQSSQATCTEEKDDAPAEVEPAEVTCSNPNESHLKLMMENAMQERDLDPSAAVAVGHDIANDSAHFGQVKTNLLEQSIHEATDFGHKRDTSFSTDEEFCMVDDIMGAGITGAMGQPRIRVNCSKKSQNDTGISINAQHFKIPDEVRTDGLSALPDNFPSPIWRCLIKDFSIVLYLYGGNDLGDVAPVPKPYSVAEYRERQGKGQNVGSDERGGTYRDHSVSVALQLNKITFLYQLFDRRAPLLSMTLASIHDVTVIDRLRSSEINELMYQYWTSENPRRTLAPMLAIRITETHKCEGKLRVSLLPVRLNIDQYTMDFLQDFFTDLVSNLRLPGGVANIASQERPVLEVPQQPRQSSSKVYPDLNADSPLNMQPLTPSPVAPSPLGDLSFFDRQEPTTKRPLEINPLITDSVLMENVFAHDSEGPQSELSDANRSRFFDDATEMQGDWASQSGIRLDSADENLIRTERTLSVDQLLMNSTLGGSIHPDLAQEPEQQDEVQEEEDQEDRDTVVHGDSSPEEGVRYNTFFKEFVFSPATAIYIDYHGKQAFNIDRDGAVIGVMKGLGKLNRTEIVLKEIVCRNGLLGIDRCVSHALDEWRDDILTNIPNVLASCGPISPLVQVGKGMYDLLWLPVSEMRKEDGHVVKGIQRGAGSFGVSAFSAIVDVAQSLVGVVQYAAETVYHEVSPQDAFLNHRNRRSITSGRSAPPTDLRHATQIAYDLVRDGVRQTRDDLDLATQENRASGQTQLRSWMRFLTPALLRPLVVTSQVTYSMLGGLKSQLRPEVCEEDKHKWKESPSTSGTQR